MTIKSKITQQSLKTIEAITCEKLTFGRFIWAIRNAEKKTQIEFAKTLDISKQHLCDIEHNRKTISPKRAAIYAKKLGYSEEQFIRLCLQDIIDREGLNIYIKIFPKKVSTQVL